MSPVSGAGRHAGWWPTRWTCGADCRGPGHAWWPARPGSATCGSSPPGRNPATDAAAYVDRAMADYLDGSLPWGRFETRLAGKVVASDPAVAEEREAARVADQFAKRTRSSEEGTAAGFYVRSTVGLIARLDATISFLADALTAFGDGDVEDLRRVKAVALLANPVRAVELLAAFAALRADSVLLRVAWGVVSTSSTSRRTCSTSRKTCSTSRRTCSTGRRTRLDRPEGSLDQPDGALARMDAFARRVGFTPRRLPDWLTAQGSGPSTATHPITDHAFEFDWSRLLPSLTMYLHFSADDLARGEGGVVRWEGEGPVTHAFVHDHLRPLHRYVIKPVIDLARQAPVDAYEVPDRLREAVHLVAPSDVFPFAWRSEPRARRGPHRRLRPVARRPGHRSCGRRGSGTSGRWDASTTGSRPTGSGCCASRSRGSTCGATRTASCTWRTTPAPARSTRGRHRPPSVSRLRPRGRGLPGRHGGRGGLGAGVLRAPGVSAPSGPAALNGRRGPSVYARSRCRRRGGVGCVWERRLEDVCGQCARTVHP